MNAHVKEVPDEGFADAIRTGVVLVDFWAPRCGPCRLQGTILDAVATVVEGKASIVKVNVDECPLAPEPFDIKTIPTLILLKEGKLVRQLVGLQALEVLVTAINEVAGS